MNIPYRGSKGPLHLLIDSTGIKFRGDGEWQARKHGPSRRRQWRKVHIAMDAGTGDVRAVEFTSSRQGDSPLLPGLLAQGFLARDNPGGLFIFILFSIALIFVIVIFNEAQRRIPVQYQQFQVIVNGPDGYD